MYKLNLSLTHKLVNIQKGKMHCVQCTSVCTILKYNKCFSKEQEHQALTKWRLGVGQEGGNKKRQHNKAYYWTKLNLPYKILPLKKNTLSMLEINLLSERKWRNSSLTNKAPKIQYRSVTSNLEPDDTVYVGITIFLP